MKTGQPKLPPWGINSWAGASFIIGIVSIVLFFLVTPSAMALIYGVLGLRTSNRIGGKPNGRGFAIAGLIMGAIGIIECFVFYHIYKMYRR